MAFQRFSGFLAASEEAIAIVKDGSDDANGVRHISIVP